LEDPIDLKFKSKFQNDIEKYSKNDREINKIVRNIEINSKDTPGEPILNLSNTPAYNLLTSSSKNFQFSTNTWGDVFALSENYLSILISKPELPNKLYWSEAFDLPGSIKRRIRLKCIALHKTMHNMICLSVDRNVYFEKELGAIYEAALQNLDAPQENRKNTNENESESEYDTKFSANTNPTYKLSQIYLEIFNHTKFQNSFKLEDLLAKKHITVPKSRKDSNSIKLSLPIHFITNPEAWKIGIFHDGLDGQAGYSASQPIILDLDPNKTNLKLYFKEDTHPSPPNPDPNSYKDPLPWLETFERPNVTFLSKNLNVVVCSNNLDMLDTAKSPCKITKSIFQKKNIAFLINGAISVSDNYETLNDDLTIEKEQLFTCLPC